MPVEISCTTDQKVRFTVSPTTSAGLPAGLDGSVTATVDAGEATVEPGLGALDVVVNPNIPGDVSGRVSGDADLGEGLVTIDDTFVIHVTSALAENLGLTGAVEND